MHVQACSNAREPQFPQRLQNCIRLLLVNGHIA
jgi:hypothetical protein